MTIRCHVYRSEMQQVRTDLPFKTSETTIVSEWMRSWEELTLLGQDQPARLPVELRRHLLS